jgi:hypothetical protein
LSASTWLFNRVISPLAVSNFLLAPQDDRINPDNRIVLMVRNMVSKCFISKYGKKAISGKFLPLKACLNLTI